MLDIKMSSYKIHTYQNNYCLNDIVLQCDISTNIKHYIASVRNKINYNSQSYLPKDKLCDLLSRCIAYKAKELLKYLNDPNTPKEKLELVNLDIKTKENELINFVDYKKSVIQFNNKKINYFVYNEQFYFKAKDIADILEYSDTKKGVSDHVNEEDKCNKEYFTLGFKGGETPPFQLIENKKLVTYLEKEHPQTIFINESGLYSLIMGSKKEEAKAFKKWVTSEVLPSIRKNGAYISKKLLEYDKVELKNYNNKDCVYILHIKDNLYKFGKSSNIKERLSKHIHTLEYINVEKIYTLNSINEITTLENDIKEFTKISKINTTYNNGIEFFECNLEFTLDKVIEKIDNLYQTVKNNVLVSSKKETTNIEQILIKLNDIESRFNVFENKLDIIETRLKTVEDKISIDLKSEKKCNLCIDCHKKTSNTTAIRCKICETNNRLKESMENGTKPTYEQLKKDLDEVRFASHIAKKYNVTPRTITRWISNYEKYNQLNPQKEKTIDISIDTIKKKCMDCDKQIYKQYIRCNDCNNKYKIKINAIESNRPSLLQLKQDMEELKSMVQVGRKYSVSDNAVRKWIKNYEKILQ
jgi:prophage antirepressor-like protein/transposase-like protein